MSFFKFSVFPTPDFFKQGHLVGAWTVEIEVEDIEKLKTLPQASFRRYSSGHFIL